MANYTGAVRWQHVLAPTRITFISRLSEQTVFSAKLSSQAIVGKDSSINQKQDGAD